MQRLSKVDKAIVYLVSLRDRRFHLGVFSSYAIASILLLISHLSRFYILDDPARYPFLTYWFTVFLCSIFVRNHTGLYATVVSALLSTLYPGTNGDIVTIEVDLWPLMFFLMAASLIAIVCDSLGHLYDAAMRLSAELSAANERNKTLIVDINHRVKNHLTVLASLIASEAIRMKMIKNSECSESLANSSNRVMVLAKLYDRLNLDSSDASTTINMFDFLNDLCNDLNSGLMEPGVSIQVNADAINIKVANAVACGLLVNELVTNSVKHADFTNNRGIINVAFRNDNNVNELVVEDNGQGKKPTGVNRSGTGTQIIRNLVSQLDGKILSGAGACGGWSSKVRFPAGT